MMHHETKQFAIVADIGGTFARFARVNLTTLHLDKIEIYPCANFISLEAVLITYQAQHLLQEIKQIAIAIACPVIGDLVCMTNCDWRFSIQELKYNLGLSELILINDFNAIAMSLSVLSSKDWVQIGKGSPQSNKTKVVLGAGTGLGVAYLIPNESNYIACSGEGGHANWGAKTELEWFIHEHLKTIYTRVSYERLLSGHGLENLYSALAAFHDTKAPPLAAADIVDLAVQHECPIASGAIKQFFSCLAGFAGDLALTFGAFGGVYIAGGIVPKLITLINQSEFRAQFEDKGRFKDFNAQIPTYVVTNQQPGMLGAAVHLQHYLQGVFDVIS
ncbi:glucokinase [Legionella sp. km772]|uniref:glucokinase n=1 Tax=Legionella sp. km772 TaxID=2498111 RepID=UPI000F8DC8F2|nr:glucokinase [Legionella sp. km772]RUR11649.1 glucokinase [Legionella sp. km772]